MANLNNVLKEVTNWFRFGLSLGLSEHCLKKIEKENEITEKCRMKALIEWKKSESEYYYRDTNFSKENQYNCDYVADTTDLSWHSVITALKEVGHTKLAERLHMDYC